MLIIRRRAGESIVIDDTEIEVVEVGNGRVKLAVQAPGHVSVCRKEVLVTRRQNAASVLQADQLKTLVSKLGSQILER